jgi:hypothetical protein
MLNASDALRAHTRCKARIAAILKQPRTIAVEYQEALPHGDCVLVRFIKEHDGDHALEPELSVLRSAHATVHSVAIGLVQKRAAGQRIDFDVEFSPSSNFGAASSSLINAVWRLEKKLHSMAQ